MEILFCSKRLINVVISTFDGVETEMAIYLRMKHLEFGVIVLKNLKTNQHALK